MRNAIALLLLAAALPLVAAEKMSYIFKRGDRAYIVSGNASVHNIGKMADRWDGDYLWAKLDGREYLIRDQAVMDEARRAFAQVEANQHEYHAIEKRMRPVAKRHDELERALDKLSDSLDDDDDELSASERRAIETRIRELERQMEPLGAQLRELEEEEERFDEKQEVLEEAAEKKLREIIRRAIAGGAAERL